MSSGTIDATSSLVIHSNPFTAARALAEQREQEREETRRIELAKQREERFQQGIREWVHRFFTSVAEYATTKQWKPAAIDQAKDYAEALVRQNDAPLPQIDPTMAEVIHSKFTYGVALDAHHKRIIPEDFFIGQRQEWFAPLFAEKLTQVPRRG